MDLGSHRSGVGRTTVVAVLVGLVFLSGCLGGGASSADTPNPTPTDRPMSASSEPPAALDSRLSRLQSASNRTAYAERHGLDLRNGRVLVVVELGNGTFPEDIDVDRQLSRDGEVVGYVPVNQLDALARSPNVTAVRPPERGATNGVTPPPTLRHT